jgi:hypothetical protein
VQGHLELARELAAEALEWRSNGAPAPPVRGDELIRELELEPGPKVGELLEQLREETFVGEVRTREQALEWARQALG